MRSVDFMLQGASHGTLSAAERSQPGSPPTLAGRTTQGILLQLQLPAGIPVSRPRAETGEVQPLLLGAPVLFTDAFAVQHRIRQSAHRAGPANPSPARLSQPLHSLSPPGQYRDVAER